MRRAIWGLFALRGSTGSRRTRPCGTGATGITVALLPDDEVDADLFEDRAPIAIEDTRVDWQWSPKTRTMDASYSSSPMPKAPLVCLYGHQLDHLGGPLSPGRICHRPWTDDPGRKRCIHGVRPLSTCSTLLPDIGTVDTDRLDAMIADALQDDVFPGDTIGSGRRSAARRHPHCRSAAMTPIVISSRDHEVAAGKLALDNRWW